MFKHFKYYFYLFLILAAVFLYWFLPKYSYVSKNPGYCVSLTQHIYYCGNNAGLDKLLNGGK